MAAAHLFFQKEKTKSANGIFNQPLRATWIWCWIITFLILDRSSICMISHPQTLFSIIVTEKQNQTKLDQSFSTPRIFECKHHIIFELKEHTIQLHISRQLFMRDIFWSNLTLCPRKNVRNEKAMAFLMLISYSLWKEGIHKHYS